jgi:hypothetical protein
MASKTDVCNLALMRMGVSQSLTNVDTDGTREALSCLVVFDKERDFVLRDFPWSRARAYATPTLATNFANPANSDWTYAYRYPSDCLFVRRILTSNGRQEVNPPAFVIGRDAAFGTAAAWSSSTAYVIGNIVIQASVVYECISGNTNQQPPNATYWRVVSNAQVIFSDQASAQIEYTAQLTDPTQWEMEFISMLAWRLAASLSLSLSRTQDMAKTCLEMYAAEKQAAEQRATIEAQKDTPVDSTDAATQELVNFALLRLGVTKDTTPKSPALVASEARYVKIAYLRERDFVLRDFPWSWATAYTDPVLLFGGPNTPFTPEWTYAFQFPSDCFFVRRIVSPAAAFPVWRSTVSGDQAWPIPFRIAAGAYGTIQIATANVLNNDTVTINGQVYKFVTTLSGAANEVLIGPDPGTTAVHLYEAINGGPNIGTDYGTGTVANTGVTATIGGSALNSITNPTTVVGNVVNIAGLNGVSVNWSKSSTALTLTPAATLQTGRIILSNQPSITIEYTRTLATPSEFDTYDRVFASMLAWRLAADLAPSRIPDPKLAEARKQGALAAYQLEKTQAQAAALREAQTIQPLDAEWIRGR